MRLKTFLPRFEKALQLVSGHFLKCVKIGPGVKNPILGADENDSS